MIGPQEILVVALFGVATFIFPKGRSVIRWIWQRFGKETIQRWLKC